MFARLSFSEVGVWFWVFRKFEFSFRLRSLAYLLAGKGPPQLRYTQHFEFGLQLCHPGSALAEAGLLPLRARSRVAPQIRPLQRTPSAGYQFTLSVTKLFFSPKFLFHLFIYASLGRVLGILILKKIFISF